MQTLFAWMSNTWLSQFMTGWQWAWPIAECLHFIGMALLFGSILVMDVRLIGFFRRDISLHAVHALTPWGLAGFLINLLTGIAFYVTRPASYQNNGAFQFKEVCILLAGVNFLVFWFVIRGQLQKVADDGDANMGAKLVGVSSIVLWTAVIWGGRLIPVYGVG
jgi:hypothetical protein